MSMTMTTSLSFQVPYDIAKAATKKQVEFTNTYLQLAVFFDFLSALSHEERFLNHINILRNERAVF
jgi:hypothetical protein